jgi:agmatinase
MADHGLDPFEGVARHWGTFLDSGPNDTSLEDARVVLVPVPYDSTTSYRSGARHGPRAIITASIQLEDYDIELDRDVSGVGIYTAPEIVPDASGPKAMIDVVDGVVRRLSQSDRIVGLLGGEHTITVGAVTALADSYPDLSVLYLDAHADLRDEYMGTRWGHASVARRLFDVSSLVEVGVRSLSAEERSFIRDNEIPVVFWPPANGGMDRLARTVIDSLSQNVHVSIDLDVLDPSVMPAVGTPEPGGMSWHDVTGLLRAVALERDIVGFDVVELSPEEGPEASAFTAAKLVYKLIGYVVPQG